ncbi:cytochrome P450, family 4, subfamily V, polypeptide 4, partial [Planoprotostelium fungivorum]
WNCSKPIYKIHVFKMPLVFFNDVQLAKEFFSSDAFEDKSSGYDVVKQFVGKDSILVASGAQWRMNHKLISQTFHINNMEKVCPVHHSSVLTQLQVFVPIMLQCAKEATDQMISLIREPSTHGYMRSVDIDHYTVQVAIEIIARTLFGVKDTKSKQMKTILECMNEGAHEIQARFYNPFRAYSPYHVYKFNSTMNTLRREIGDIISHRRQLLEHKKANEEEINERDFVDLLLLSTDTEGNSLSNSNIIDQCITFFFAGHDTTAHTMAWAFHLVSSQPRIEEKILKEISDVIGDRDDISMSDLNNLKYLNMVIKETLRLYPPANATPRQTTRDTTLGPYHFKKGQDLMFHLSAAQLNPAYFKEPTLFLPERFEDEKNMTPLSNIPFSKGDRSCIGQKFAILEMKAVLAFMLRRVVFRPDVWAQLRIEATVTTQPKSLKLVPTERKRE